MHRTTRMLGILIALQAGPSTADDLAARFEVSRRTILRDMAQLELLDVPLVARSGVGGGYTLPAWWRFAPTPLSDDEVETLLLALDHLGHGTDAAVPGIDALAEKMRAALRPEVVARVTTDPTRSRVVTDLRPPEPQVNATIRAALGRGDWLEFAYQVGRGPSERFVKPISTDIAGGRWYLVALDRDRRATRHFRIDRMREVRRRLAPADASEIELEATSRPDYADPGYPEVVVALTERGRLWCLDHADFHDHVSGHELRFRCPPGEYPYYLRELLRFGLEVRLVAPPEARCMLVSILRELQDHLLDQ